MTPFRQFLVVGSLLAAYFFLALSATLDKCTTYDEVAHLTAGYSYWLFNDYRLQPENGNLPQRWAVLPLLVTRPTFPSIDQPDWYLSNVWSLGDQFFYHNGNNLGAMLLQGRAMIALLGVALGLLVYRWSARLFGSVGGLVSLTLYVFCPNLLAHGALVTSDLAASLFFLAGVASVWKLLQRVSWWTFCVSSLALVGLFVSKFSAVIVVPVLGLMVVVRLIDGRPLPVRWGGERTIVLRRRQFMIFTLALLLQVIVVVAGIWTFYGGRYTAFARAEPGRDRFILSGSWDALENGEHSMVIKSIFWARDKHLLPEAYLYGFAYTMRSAELRSSFLNGEKSLFGWRSYFPYAFLVKTPLGVFIVLALAVLGGMLAFRARIRSTTTDSPGSKPSHNWRWQAFYPTIPLWILLVVYWTLAINSRINIGLRHLLPTYAPMYILAGAAAVGTRLKLNGPPSLQTGTASNTGDIIRWVALAGAVGWVVVASLLAWPNYLAYFNESVGSRNGYKHLVDSNLDWGQDLPGLKRWLDKRDTKTGGRGEKEAVYLLYFGKGDPKYYGIDAIRLDHPDRPDEKFGPGIYCISATHLQAVYLNEAIGVPFLRLLRYLRLRAPDDEIGYSILIFHVSEEDLRKAFGLTPP